MASMTRRRKLTFAAGAVGTALFVAALGAASALSASWVLSPNEEREALIDDAASQLGVEPSELSNALEQALKNRIDEAVESGRLTEEQGDELKERIDAEEYPPFGGLRMLAPGHGGFGFHRLGGGDILEAAASYLGLTQAQLRAALEDQTLAEIAEERGKTSSGLVQHLVATQTKRIDEALADGRITDDQAARLEAGLDERMEALVDGQLRGRGDWPRHRFWPGSGAPRAPPAFGGPPA
jgi:hypothetical protein